MSTTSKARDDQGRRNRRAADPGTPPRAARQPSLFDRPDVVVGASIDARFLTFHERYPHVYRRLVALALDLRAKGVQRYGMKALFEVVRYEGVLKTAAPGEPFVLNNDYTSRYSRLIEAQEPRLKGFFTTRRLPSREGVEGAEE